MLNILPDDTFDIADQNLTALQQKYRDLEAEYQKLSERYNTLEREYEELKQSRSKAGRKPNDEKWTAKYQAFAELKRSGVKREQIQQQLNMSRATYFRYNKVYADGGVPGQAGGDSEMLSSPTQTAVHGEAPVKTKTAEPVMEVSEAPVRVSEPVGEIAETTARASEPLQPLPSSGLVLDPETGDYVTPEGLKRRRKLAEIRARRAAEAALKREEEEKAAAETDAVQE